MQIIIKCGLISMVMTITSWKWRETQYNFIKVRQHIFCYICWDGLREIRQQETNEQKKAETEIERQRHNKYVTWLYILCDFHLTNLTGSPLSQWEFQCEGRLNFCNHWYIFMIQRMFFIKFWISSGHPFKLHLSIFSPILPINMTALNEQFII